MTNTATNFLSAIRTSYDTVTLIVQDSSFNTYTTVIPLQDTNDGTPSAPTLATAATGGTVLAGSYIVEVSYVDESGNAETGPSGPATIVTTGSTSTITVSSPPALTSGTAPTGWYAYVSQANGTTLTRQQTAGSPTAIGTALTLTAPPSSSGLAPLTYGSDKPVSMIMRAFLAS